MAQNLSDPPQLQRTPLHDLHWSQQARLVPFSGWEMPVQFTGITAEHQAVRQQVGMFDISHMGKFVLRGDRLIEQLQRLVPSDLSRLQPGGAKYTVLLNHQGGIIDDLIFYHQGQATDGRQQVSVIVNAATTTKDKTWLLNHLDPAVDFEDLTHAQALIAVQGPEALSVLQPLVQPALTEIKPYHHLTTSLWGQSAFLARTGYTGEDGFEIMVAPKAARQLWQLLFQQGVVPCGLGARDTLRLEAAMLLYGQDMDETITPLEAGLNWLVQFAKGEFLGRAALEQQSQQGITRQLVGLQMQGRHIARHGYPVLYQDRRVGTVTSGSFTPTLAQAIALAYVPPQLAEPGQTLAVEIRGKACPAAVVKRPFYRRNPK